MDLFVVDAAGGAPQRLTRTPRSSRVSGCLVSGRVTDRVRTRLEALAVHR